MKSKAKLPKRRGVLPKQKPRVHKDKKKEAKKTGVLVEEHRRWTPREEW